MQLTHRRLVVIMCSSLVLISASFAQIRIASLIFTVVGAFVPILALPALSSKYVRVNALCSIFENTCVYSFFVTVHAIACSRLILGLQGYLMTTTLDLDTGAEAEKPGAGDPRQRGLLTPITTDLETEGKGKQRAGDDFTEWGGTRMSVSIDPGSPMTVNPHNYDLEGGYARDFLSSQDGTELEEMRSHRGPSTSGTTGTS